MRAGFDRDRHSRIVAHLVQPASVADCLVYADMIDVPPPFDRFAREHFAEYLSAEGIVWSDVCSVYALALMARGSYRLPDDEAEMRTLWEELASSRLHWRQAKAIVADVWDRLDRSDILAHQSM